MNSSEESLDSRIQRAVALLRGAVHAVALTGAGVSTPSGIPDFRSNDQGLWGQVDQMAVASIWGFRRDPAPFFEWIRPLARLIHQAQPNDAHRALAGLEAQGIVKELVTQNIDVLHHKAGSHTIYELHGDFRQATCVECFRVYPVEQFIEPFIAEGVMPRCAHCGGVLKPNVILFGEAMPVQALQQAQRAARTCDVMLVAGSSLAVAPASELPQIALAYGAELIIINFEKTYIDQRAQVVIHDDVARILPRLANLLAGEESR